MAGITDVIAKTAGKGAGVSNVSMGWIIKANECISINLYMYMGLINTFNLPHVRLIHQILQMHIRSIKHTFHATSSAKVGTPIQLQIICQWNVTNYNGFLHFAFYVTDFMQKTNLILYFILSHLLAFNFW